MKTEIEFTPQRDEWLLLDEDKLLQDCTIDFFKSTGPGGQKKNKTSSAVRLIHRPSGIQGVASEERQQSVNRKRAVKRLRIELALELRSEAQIWEGSWDMNPKNPQYPLFIARVFDALYKHNFEISTAAAWLGRSTGQLIKTLAREDQIWKHCNCWRQKFGHNPLKKNR